MVHGAWSVLSSSLLPCRSLAPPRLGTLWHAAMWSPVWFSFASPTPRGHARRVGAQRPRLRASVWAAGGGRVAEMGLCARRRSTCGRVWRSRCIAPPTAQPAWVNQPHAAIRRCVRAARPCSWPHCVRGPLAVLCAAAVFMLRLPAPFVAGRGVRAVSVRVVSTLALRLLTGSRRQITRRRRVQRRGALFSTITARGHLARRALSQAPRPCFAISSLTLCHA